MNSHCISHPHFKRILSSKFRYRIKHYSLKIPEAVPVIEGSKFTWPDFFKWIGNGNTMKGSRWYRSWSNQKKRNELKHYFRILEDI